jgi:uncharacterized protein (DUF697 family)
MNKKKLPKAIMRLPDGLHESNATSLALEPIRADAAIDHAPGASPAIAADPDPAAEGMTIATRSEAAPSPARALTRLQSDDARRRRLAAAVVERHANYSALGGVIPLPFVNFAAVLAIILRMVRALSSLYGVPFERDRARAVVLGLIGGLTPTAASTMTASTLFYLIPGSNLVGLAVSSVTASACTRKIGGIFVEHFESGATLVDFPASGSRRTP